MAEIFQAKLVGAAGFEKEVAVKRILPQWSQHQDFVTMLIDEAKIAVRLAHPNIVQVHELGREGEVYYIAMEYVAGTDVRKLMRRGGLPEEVALRIAIETLEGLGYAHRFGVVHRDISPQNLLVSDDGMVKVTDFGIAKAASKTHETATGVIKGKFAYMSPEQAGQGDVDARSDLFSTAVVLYEMLTGERLFYAGSDVATLDRVRRADLSPTPSALKAIPGPLFALLRKALARSREERYAAADSFRDALQGYAQSRGLKIRREDLADYLRSAVPPPDARKPTVKSDERTEVMPEATAMMVEETRTVRREVSENSEISEVLVERRDARAFVDDPTRLAAFPEAFKTRRENRARRFPPLVTAALAGAALLLAVSVYALKDAPEAPPAIASTPMPALPELPKNPQPVEVAEPAVAVPVPETPPQAASPETTTSSPETPALVALNSGVTVSETVPKKATTAKPEGKGYLSVQATPWGTVSVDGGKRRWETPVRRLPLTSGRHTVRVTYEPDGSAVASAITVVAGKEIVCVAKFRGGKELRCKN